MNNEIEATRLNVLVLLLNETLAELSKHYAVEIKSPASANQNDLMFWNNKFQKVIATAYEQGSGPRPSRCSVAFENNSQIVEPNTYHHGNFAQHTVVLTPKKEKEKNDV